MENYDKNRKKKKNKAIKTFKIFGKYTQKHIRIQKDMIEKNIQNLQNNKKIKN